jgi:hypothetical protein
LPTKITLFTEPATLSSWKRIHFRNASRHPTARAAPLSAMVVPPITPAQGAYDSADDSARSTFVLVG